MYESRSHVLGGVEYKGVVEGEDAPGQGTVGDSEENEEDVGRVRRDKE